MATVTHNRPATHNQPATRHPQPPRSRTPPSENPLTFPRHAHPQRGTNPGSTEQRSIQNYGASETTEHRNNGASKHRSIRKDTSVTEPTTVDTTLNDTPPDNNILAPLVTGPGPAGLQLARHLRESGSRYTVLEAGEA